MRNEDDRCCVTRPWHPRHDMWEEDGQHCSTVRVTSGTKHLGQNLKVNISRHIMHHIPITSNQICFKLTGFVLNQCSADCGMHVCMTAYLDPFVGGSDFTCTSQLICTSQPTCTSQSAHYNYNHNTSPQHSNHLHLTTNTTTHRYTNIRKKSKQNYIHINHLHLNCNMKSLETHHPPFL